MIGPAIRPNIVVIAVFLFFATRFTKRLPTTMIYQRNISLMKLINIDS